MKNFNFLSSKKAFFSLGIFLIITLLGFYVSVFNKNTLDSSHSVLVDLLPNLSENQQIISVNWDGYSPKDIEEQITLPLTSNLLSIAKVKSIRSFSMFGYSTIYVIFEDGVDWDFARIKLQEKINSISSNFLPSGVSPKVGPDANSLGQIFWYTVEGEEDLWSLSEIRDIQDYQIKYALQSTKGVAEIESIGGFQREIHIEIDQKKIDNFKIDLEEVISALKKSNRDSGAGALELKNMDFMVRAIGSVHKIKDIENILVKFSNNKAIYLSNIARIYEAPMARRAMLDSKGSEVVGAVVVARHGKNKKSVINELKRKIIEIEKSLPTKINSKGDEVRLRIIPFYDRSIVIEKGIKTLADGIKIQLLISFILVLMVLKSYRGAIIVCLSLPIAISCTFLMMKFFGIEANLISLAGIIIAFGSIVDTSIIINDDLVRKLGNRAKLNLREISLSYFKLRGAILTALASTIISFLPLFFLGGMEGKLFTPLAYTKTFVFLSTMIVTIFLLPVLTLLYNIYKPLRFSNLWLILLVFILSCFWKVYAEINFIFNFILLIIFFLLINLLFKFALNIYPRALKYFLRNSFLLLAFTFALIFSLFFSWRSLPKIFMPSIDEGSFLFMPSTVSSASFSTVKSILQKQNFAISCIPEVESVVGKLGRVDSALDPAPMEMIETVINYKDEFLRDKDGNKIRQWRNHIKNSDDIWREVENATSTILGVSGAPKLYPINARIVMLQSGIRANMGVKIQAQDDKKLQDGVNYVLDFLDEIDGINKGTIFSDRTIDKPYLEIELNREKIARYGLTISKVQNIIKTAIGGTVVSTVYDGRKRVNLRLIYNRENRNSLQGIRKIFIKGANGRVNLSQISDIKTVLGPQVIKSEDGFLVSYVTFDGDKNVSEEKLIKDINSKLKNIPEVQFSLIGSFEHYNRLSNKLFFLIPISLLIIFMILYYKFRDSLVCLIIFISVFVAWAGAFLFIIVLNQTWFLDFDILGINLREFFGIKAISLSISVWVGLLALFGLATDDGVLMANSINHELLGVNTNKNDDIEHAIIAGACKRNRPAILTTLTTLIALLPIFGMRQTGSDLIYPMLIPIFGGLFFSLITVFLYPVLFYKYKKIGEQD